MCNASTGKVLEEFEGLNDRTIAMCESPNGKYFAAASGPSKGKVLESSDIFPENRVVIWKSNGQILQDIQIDEGWQWAVTFTPDSRYLITGGSGTVEIGDGDWFGHNHDADTNIRVWEVESGELVQTLEGHNAAVLGLAVTPDGKTLVSSSSDSTVRLWDLADELLDKSAN